MVEKSGFEEFMVEKSGVEETGVDKLMVEKSGFEESGEAWGWTVDISTSEFLNSTSAGVVEPWVDKLMVEKSGFEESGVEVLGWTVDIWTPEFSTPDLCLKCPSLKSSWVKNLGL